MTAITDKERAEIRRLIRDREKLAKAMAAERSAELLAGFERQIATNYKWSESDVWTEAVSKAEAAVDRAKHAIASECDRLGIPSAFRPSINVFWSGRGENAVKERRDELRRVAKAEIGRIEEQAKVAIERAHLRVRVKLTEIGLNSPDAKQFLAALPAIEGLMPPLNFEHIEQMMLQHARNHGAFYRLNNEAGAEED